MHRERDEERRLTMRGGRPAAFSRRRRKGIKGRQKAAFNGRGPTMPGRGSCTLRPSVHACGSAVYRYRFPPGRDNPLTSVQPPSSPPPLLKAHCCWSIVRKQHFRRSRWRQEEDLNSSPSQQSASLGVGGHRPMHLTRVACACTLPGMPPTQFLTELMIILKRSRESRKHSINPALYSQWHIRVSSAILWKKLSMLKIKVVF